MFVMSRLVKVLLSLLLITMYVVLMYVFKVSNLLHKLKSNIDDEPKTVQVVPLSPTGVEVEEEPPDRSLKYILMWTHNFTYPFIYLKSGQQAFVEEKCEYTNCFVSNNRSYFPDLTQWDALLFHAPEFTWAYKAWSHGYPERRSPRQKYIFACIESSDNYPSCDPKFNDYFNWTWTYKVTSDVRWGYMGIRDIRTGKIVGPKADMIWEENMADLSEYQKYKLKTKTKAAAWFVSNCFTNSKREDFVKRLEKSLNKYNLTVDIYGKCGNMICERDTDECWKRIERDYYFYLSFENSFSEDYVTEKFLHAMKNSAVPVVWGGADYSRFAPPGSYIDASSIKNADKVAETMYHLIRNFDEYTKYFRWVNYYEYQRDVETPDTRAFCLMCAALNNSTMMSTHKTYRDFNKWWNGDRRC